MIPDLSAAYHRINGPIPTRTNRVCSYIALVCVVGIWVMVAITWGVS